MIFIFCSCQTMASHFPSAGWLQSLQALFCLRIRTSIRRVTSYNIMPFNVHRTYVAQQRQHIWLYSLFAVFKKYFCIRTNCYPTLVALILCMWPKVITKADHPVSPGYFLVTENGVKFWTYACYAKRKSSAALLEKSIQTTF